MIRGVPVYRLTGVTAANLPVIKSTGMWVHYRHLGDAGWCLAVPDPLFDAVTAALGEHDIGFESLQHLPERSNAMFYLGAVWGMIAAVAFGYMIAEAGAETFGGLIILASPFVGIALIGQRGKSGAQYGALTMPTPRRTSQSFAEAATAEESAYFRYRSPGCSHMAGTVAHTMHGD